MGRSNDFKFWEEKLPVRHRSCGDEGEFCEVQRRGEDQVGAFSPPLWGRARVELRPETSTTLLPQNHQYSCLSPASRVRAIIDGRRELMEMIKDLPESSYELSLKDIVDQQNTGDVQEKEAAVAEELEVKHIRKNRVIGRAKSSNTKQICRSESMESDVFLLKMFLPVSLSSKKKASPRKLPRICSGQSSEGHEKRANKDWWKMIFLAVRDDHKNTNIIRTSNISNRTSEKKYKSRRQRGCLF